MKEARYVRNKQIFEEDNILMIASNIHLIVKGNGKVESVDTVCTAFEEYPLNDVPTEIENLSECDIPLNKNEFDVLKSMYKNDSKQYIYFNKTTLTS